MSTYITKDITVPKHALKGPRKNIEGMDEQIQSLLVDMGKGAYQTEMYIAMAVIPSFLGLCHGSATEEHGSNGKLTEFGLASVLFGVSISYLFGTGKWDKDGFYEPFVPSMADITDNEHLDLHGEEVSMHKFLVRVDTLINRVAEESFALMFKGGKKGVIEDINLEQAFSVIVALMMTLKNLKEDVIENGEA